MRQIAYRAKIRVKIELLSQLNVDAGKASTHRRSDRAFERDARALDRFGEFLGNVLFVFFVGLGPSLNGFPFKFQAGGFEDANDSLCDFGTNPVAGN